MGESGVVAPEFRPVLRGEFGGLDRRVAGREPLAGDRHRSLAGPGAAHVEATVVLVAVRDAFVQVPQGSTDHFRPT